MKNNIGVVLAGGTGSRLYPITISTNKHLLPIYSKPLIYYSLSTLMLAEIENILIVINPEDEHSFTNILGDGSDYGINITYVHQEEPKGLSHALSKCKNYAKNKNVNLILGDNIFFGKGLQEFLINAKSNYVNCFFSQEVKNPENFGVLERDEESSPKIIHEKPLKPRSSEAILGLYFYDNEVFDIIDSINPSERGELEITTLNNKYLHEKDVKVLNIGRGIHWFDAGTVGDLYEATNFIQTIENRQKTLVGSIEEVAFNNGWISEKQLLKKLNEIKDTDYGKLIYSKYFK